MKTQITKSLLILTLTLVVSACGGIDGSDEVSLNRDPNIDNIEAADRQEDPNQQVAGENPEGTENYGSPGDAPAYQGESIITNTYGGQVGGDGNCNYVNFGSSSYASPGC